MSVARSATVLVGSALLLAGFVAVLYGAGDGAVVLLMLLLPGAAALALAHAAARRRRRLGPLGRQFGLAGALAGGQLVLVLAAGAAVMFVSPHDAVLALVLVAGAGVVGLRSAQLLAYGALADVRDLRDTLVAVGRGGREPVAPPRGADELAELNHAANRAIGQLAETERARRDLVAAVSHDLRTPVTSLRLLAEAVDDQVVSGDERQRYLGQMRGHVTVLSDLIDDLFELSRLEAGEGRRTPQPVSLPMLVEEAVAAMHLQAAASGVAVRTALPGHVDAACGDPEQLRRVLLNLLQNAIRHTPADGSVTVSAEPVGGRVEVEVADTGAGIAAAERPRVFEPFFRGGSEAAARSGDGAGLGLAISRAIVEAHGGRIWLEEAARGTRVRFSLPAAGRTSAT